MRRLGRWGARSRAGGGSPTPHSYLCHFFFFLTGVFATEDAHLRQFMEFFPVLLLHSFVANYVDSRPTELSYIRRSPECFRTMPAWLRISLYLVHLLRSSLVTYFVEYLLHFLFYFFHPTYSRWSPLPSCLWSLRIVPSLPGSRLTVFSSRCKFSILTTRHSMVDFFSLTY